MTVLLGAVCGAVWCCVVVLCSLRLAAMADDGIRAITQDGAITQDEGITRAAGRE